MRKLLFGLLVATTVLIGSCATIVSGSRQIVKISSVPQSATVYINEIEIGQTPLEKNLKRNQEYDILIKLDGYQPFDTKLTKEFNAWYLGNILFGGLIGIIIDPITGAIYRLSPAELTARMQDGTSFTSKSNSIYLAVELEIDSDWEQVGQLRKTK